jgi:signal transduction histidine kinase
MGFRLRLFLGVSIAVLLSAALYGVLGFLAFRSNLEHEREESLESFTQAAISSVDVSGSRPVFAFDEMNQAVFEEYSTSRFRVSKDNQTVLEFRGAFPVSASGWLIEQVALENGFTLDVAFSTEESSNALHNYWRTTALALPISLAFALLLSYFLQRLLLKPMRDLRNATAVLSKQSIPEPVEVPPGNDELSQLAESFNRMTLSLQAFIERERSFTRYASHELRTPLSNLRVLIEGAQKNLFSPEEVWSKLEDNLKRMEGILSGLLTLTRSPKLNPEPVLVDALIQEVIGNLNTTVRSRISYTPNKNSLIALGQDDLVKNVITNLVNNGLKYSEGNVAVTATETKQNVTITISDQGSGVPSEALTKLTEPFFRVDTRKGGLGLGLALVKHIVEAMQGRLELKNLDPGFQATVYLPHADIKKTKETVYA